jgi:hypothetical protein
MKKSHPESVVDELLEHTSPPTRRNMVIDMPELAAAIKYFLELKAVGHPSAKHITLRWFYIHKLREQFDGPMWFGTVRRYVREVMKLDPATGKSL